MSSGMLGQFALALETLGWDKDDDISVEIAENWKEMLLILFGAFVGNLNKVVDYWFNSEDRDKMLIQKVDEEDGQSLSNISEYPTAPRPPQEPIVIIQKEEVTPEPVVEEPLPYVEPRVGITK